MMENQSEKIHAVLKKKHYVLCNILDMKKCISSIKTNGLLSEKIDLKAEISNRVIVAKWLDVVQRNMNDETFGRFQKFLEEQHLYWLKNEIDQELKYEIRSLTTEDYVRMEAGMLVQKHWGTNKRLSESDKRNIHNVLAERYQIAKEAYNGNFEDLTKQLMKTRKEMRSQEQTMEDMKKEILLFIQKHQRQLNAYLPDKITPLQALKPSKQDDYKFDALVGSFLEVTYRIMFEKDTLEEEKIKCLRILQIQNSPVSLDVALTEELEKLKRKLKEAEVLIDEKHQKSEIIDERYSKLQQNADRKLQQKQREVSDMEEMIKVKDERIRKLEKQCEEAEDQMETMNVELENLKARVELLTKSRKLGYLSEILQ